MGRSAVALSLAAGAAAEALLHAAPQALPAAVQAALGVGPYGRRSQRSFYQAWHALAAPDAAAGYRCAPHLDVWLSGHRDFAYRVRTNDRGLRTPHQQGPLEVAAIGDSFTFGYGVDEAAAWPAALAELTGWRVANLGVSGYGPQSELAVLCSDGLALRPRLVLWQFFANDYEDAGLFARWQQSGQPDLYRWLRQVPDEQAPAPLAATKAGGLRGWLHRHVRSYELAKYALGVGGYGPGGYPPWVRVKGAALQLELARAARWADFDRAEIRVGWQLTCDCLLQARRMAEEGGARFAVVLAPSKEESYWARLPRRQTRLAGDVRGSSRRMAAFCRQQGLPCLDLGPSFAAAGQAGQALYFAVDAHWNPAGHALAARHVARFARTILATGGLGRETGPSD
ncbi:MAG: SGNH/GDSL hydrolase family protein [Anaerolinea sp.]|nr:SGNH/GDSL hydrolase family protein [Anaerolinea sp.]